ncbi:hypothetical protein MSIBF_A4380001 [groundwater metagenome]|uniref:Uncharacterized protein n=1 Tax=groundwater metagenome TaxID=717931 RepID=A0A098EDQ3_9ZZZZ
MRKASKNYLKLVGINKVADIFYKQTSPERMRINYRPRTINFFRLYFKKNAPGSSN